MKKKMTKEEYKEILKTKISELLKTHKKRELAKKLKISRQTLYNYMREFDIDYKNLSNVNNYGIIDSGELEKRIDSLLDK
jgi:DNA invertase Pin-like site-specific DNA recombinase